jgi:hypothetical protein
MKILLIIFLIFKLSFTWCQVKEERKPSFSKAKVELEVVPLKLSFNPGIYRSRLGINPALENKFNQFGAFIQLYLPFQRSLDKVEAFEEKGKDSAYFGRLVSIRPVALVHITNRGGNCAGLGIELSLRLSKRFFFTPQISLVWVEANNLVSDGLRRGLNFHHYWHFSYCITSKIAVTAGFNHISNGNFLSSKPSSNYDMITTGVSYVFK